ncbi:hypothetical protein LCGC14_0627960 [marine sediment metagenome]|uniref:Lin1244/Lin1753-like N-terminal domain-containing protein n=1 Tax=marine sediment metagenome TaxID=412755 RepID=A0A0F9TPB6_9ZZZZ
MARPQKHTVDYFPHDADASAKKTLTIIESKFGNDGYAFWFKLLELLGNSPDHYIDCSNDTTWEFLLAKTRLDETNANNLLALLAKLDAIDSRLWHDARLIWSQNFINRIADVYKNRRQPVPTQPSSNNQEPSTDIVSTTQNPKVAVVPTGDNTQTKLKETKLKETKGRGKVDGGAKIPPSTGLKVKEVFGKIDIIRGYRPPKRRAEAASIFRMLKIYSVSQIIRAWEELKKDIFWQKKELFMMTVESQIGALQQNGNINKGVKHQSDVTVIG